MMKKILHKKILSLVLAVMLLLIGFMSVNTYAQQVPRYTQYMMNEFIVNPAMAGSDGRTIVNLSGRKEWVGFGNGGPTPQTYSLSIQHRTLDREYAKILGASGSKYENLHKSNVGWGLSFVNDLNGAIQRQGVSLTYAYHLFLNPAQLSFGLTGSFTQLSIRSKYLNFENNSDIMMGLSNGSIWTPDIAFGINLKYPHLQIGLSAVQLLQSSVVFGNTEVNLSSSNERFRRTYFLMASYLGDIKSSTNWKYEPSILIKTNDQFSTGVIAQGDIVMRMIYQDDLWFGLGYRTSSDVIALIGFRYNRVYFTYSFDYGNSEMMKYTYGSHEISVSLKLGSSVKRIRCVTPQGR
jgi:type IX secretion system PorP/SprF family membrane protein